MAASSPSTLVQPASMDGAALGHDFARSGLEAGGRAPGVERCTVTRSLASSRLERLGLVGVRQRIFLGLSALSFGCALFCAGLRQSSVSQPAGEVAFTSTVVDKDPPLEFPPTEPMAYAWWGIILYMFYIMAIVCDDYLVPAVDVICDKFQIPEDVAGATLVAFACNGPELLTNVCAIFISESKVGMGTIVGSAIFNVMCIVGACAIATPGGTLTIPSRVFLRDAFFSALSIVILMWSLPDIDMLKGSVLFGMSFVYVLVVAKSASWFGLHPEEEGKAVQEKLLADHLLPTEDKDALEHPLQHETFAENLIRQVSAETEDHSFSRFLELPSSKSGGSFWGLCRLCAAWIVFLPVAFTNLALYFTIPDVKRNSRRRLYLPAFVLSMMWLSATAFAVCLGADDIRKYWGIPESFIGLTIVSIGTSFPNLWASIVTARAGRGDMAVSNALGSNVQNVFFVLAFPIWLRVLQKGGYQMSGGDIDLSIAWMLFTLSLVVAVCALQRWRLSSPAGYFFFSVYLVYLCVAAKEDAS